MAHARRAHLDLRRRRLALQRLHSHCPRQMSGRGDEPGQRCAGATGDDVGAAIKVRPPVPADLVAKRTTPPLGERASCRRVDARPRARKPRRIPARQPGSAATSSNFASLRRRGADQVRAAASSRDMRSMSLRVAHAVRCTSHSTLASGGSAPAVDLLGPTATSALRHRCDASSRRVSWRRRAARSQSAARSARIAMPSDRCRFLICTAAARSPR